MIRRGSIILVLTIVVLSVLVALPGCGEKTEGDTGNGSTSAGKPELILFTQEACPPCIPAHDIVDELEEEMSDKVNFRVVYAENDFETFRKYGVQATPTIAILDGSGNIVGMAAGVPDKGVLKSELEKLL